MFPVFPSPFTSFLLSVESWVFELLRILISLNPFLAWEWNSLRNWTRRLVCKYLKCYNESPNNFTFREKNSFSFPFAHEKCFFVCCLEPFHKINHDYCSATAMSFITSKHVTGGNYGSYTCILIPWTYVSFCRPVFSLEIYWLSQSTDPDLYFPHCQC